VHEREEGDGVEVRGVWRREVRGVAERVGAEVVEEPGRGGVSSEITRTGQTMLSFFGRSPILLTTCVVIT